MRLAWLGLGVMGAPMAARLAQAGHELAVYNRSPPRLQAWLAQNQARVAASPAEAADGADVVFCCVTADADTREVATGAQGAFAGMSAGAVFVDHGSGSPAAARSLAVLARECGLDFLDAPVTGGEPGAKAGTLSILAGGDAATLDKVRPALGAYAAAVTLMGLAGAGHLTKLVNVVIGHGNGLALAEGLAFAERGGLDPTQVVQALSGGSSQSWHMQHRSAAMIARDYRTRYPVAFALKDIGAAVAEARELGVPVRVSLMALDLYRGLDAAGFGARDVACLMETYAAPDPGPEE